MTLIEYLTGSTNNIINYWQKQLLSEEVSSMNLEYLLLEIHFSSFCLSTKFHYPNKVSPVDSTLSYFYQH